MVPFESASILQAGAFRGQQSFTWSEFASGAALMLAKRLHSLLLEFTVASLPYQVLPFLFLSLLLLLL